MVGRKKIRRMAEQLLHRIDSDNSEVDVKGIAQLLDIQLREEPLGNISGMLYREGNQIIIGVNSSHPETRRRFTIAHEIGHLLLHNHNSLYVDKAFPVRRRDQMSSEAVYIDEIEANAFAAELLMPAFMLENETLLQDKVIDYEWDDRGVLKELANRYNVSRQAMTFRLINLGFIEEHL